MTVNFLITLGLANETFILMMVTVWLGWLMIVNFLITLVMHSY